MGFASGSISFHRYAVIGTQPVVADELFEKLKEHAIGDNDIVEEVNYGWSGGRHVYDNEFSAENNFFNDCLSIGLRIDTNKVPGDVKKSWLQIEEQQLASQNPSGFLSKAQKKQAKETVKKMVDEAVKTQKYQKSRVIPILWDLSRGYLYTPAKGSAYEKLSEIIERTFKVTIKRLDSGEIAQWAISQKEFDDLKPSKFAHGPESETQNPDYPWIAKSTNNRNFLGNEFLLWLWYKVDEEGGVVPTFDDGPFRNVTVFFDRVVNLECAYGQNGKDSFRGTAVERLSEVKQALRSGKVPRQMGMMVEVASSEYHLTLDPEGFSFSGVKLPSVEEAETPRVLFEERITLLRDLVEGFEVLFKTFLNGRVSTAVPTWAEEVSDISRWISKGSLITDAKQALMNAGVGIEDGGE
jgi:hypothetical protein